jgi:mono/diheme cytochrome c family protein
MTVRRGRVLVAAAALAAAAGSWSEAAAQAPSPSPQIKEVPARGFVGIEGKDTYAAYCAVCHGASGRGDGPAAPALKGPVPDLTTLAKRHGKFDRVALERTILGTDKMPVAHGTVTMPIWGPVFTPAGGDKNLAMLRAQNVLKYIESMQAN